MTDQELMRHIERSPGQRAGYKQLVRELSLPGGRERRLLLEHLARLTAAGRLSKDDREHWAIASAARSAALRDNLVAGRLDLHRDGFGFVRVTAARRAPGDSRSPRASSQPDTGDIFIPPTEINGAMQGDQVLVELAAPRSHARGEDRKSGRIVRVLTRRNPTIVGTFHYATSDRQQGHQVTPFDEKMAQPVLIPFDEPLPEPVARVSAHRVLGDQAAAARYDDLEGLIVDVEVTEWPTPTRVARGRVVEVLGHPDAFGVDVEMVIRKHQLPRLFPDNVLEQARAVAGSGLVASESAAASGRRDFRDQPIVTIDGETARDFDDAVLVRALADESWELEVHIADVAEYVQPATALDLEARLRGNSVYFPDRAIPMLPHELSSGICSLRPDEDRLVLSCLMQIDARGEVTGYEIVEGVIRSARRMTYTQVAAILGDDETPPDAALRAEFAPLVPEFENMQRLAKLLNRKREQRGSIDFDLPEPIIEFDEFGAMKAVTRSTRNWAHRLIEEFMLAANESVASWLEPLAPSLYRIHEKPDPRRILDFEDTAASFGYSLGVGNLPVKRFALKNDRRDAQRSNDRHGRGSKSTNTRSIEIPEEIPVTPRMYQKLAAKIAGKPEERILSYLMLRSLKQARYSEENEGHFALAAPCYTHFTSPIRRYPDLIVHRIAKTLLRAGVSGRGKLVAGEPHSRKTAPGPWAESASHKSADAHAKKSGHAKPEDIPGLARFADEHISELSDLERQAHLSKVGGEKRRNVPRGTLVEEHASKMLPDALLPESELAAIAQESSENERRAAAAERELVEWKKIKFMQDRIGDEFAGMILSATKYGLFVELADLFIEGLVPLGSLGALDGDYYIYHEPTREIIGEHFKRTFRIGQQVRVQLDRIDAIEKRLQFSILLSEEEAAAIPSRFPRLGEKKASKPKKEKKRKSAQLASPKSRIPAPKKTGKHGKRKH